MARFNTGGLNDLMAQMALMGEDTGEIADKILLAGAEEVKKAWKASAEKHGHRNTGDLINSIGYPRSPKKVGELKAIDIYPQGKNRNGRRNAEIAFILHYGTSKIDGSHWVDDADVNAGPEVERVVTEIWDEELRKRGM